ncbi:MAG: hypothetical protein F6K13_33145, partial [Okeania sp. SIO2B9]|nr:hypothetical protein [Okeania sp. SIO2B9]
LIEPFCTGGTCHAMLDGRPIFTDTNHLAFSMSPRVALILEAEHARLRLGIFE